MQSKKPELLDRAGLKQALFDLLARRDYSHHELIQKLHPRAQDPNVLLDLLEAMAEQGLQSDSRFSENFVRARATRYGPIRLKQELRMKGISGELSAETLESAQQDWRAQAREIFKQKFPSFDANDLKQKAKAYRFLAQRGFSSADIAWALKIEVEE